MTVFLITCIALIFQGQTVNPPLGAVTGKSIPVLCYHNIKKNSRVNNALYISEQQLQLQLKTLYDSGYHTITPSEYAAFYLHDSPLPPKPVIITFDDSHEEHYTIAKRLLDNFSFKGVFFIMTVTINKKGFLSSEQIKDLSHRGHIIGAHTWDHPNLTVNAIDWKKQISNPVTQLEKITGLETDCFAYPYGAWNDKAISELRKSGIRTAFQLTGPKSVKNPLLTIRRMMVNGNWNGPALIRQMQKNFQNI